MVMSWPLLRNEIYQKFKLPLHQLFTLACGFLPHSLHTHLIFLPMLRLALAYVLLLAAAVLSGTTPIKRIAESAMKGIQYYDPLSSDIPLVDDSFHVPSVETQYDLAFPKTFPR